MFKHMKVITRLLKAVRELDKTVSEIRKQSDPSLIHFNELNTTEDAIKITQGALIKLKKSYHEINKNDRGEEGDERCVVCGGPTYSSIPYNGIEYNICGKKTEFITGKMINVVKSSVCEEFFFVNPRYAIENAIKKGWFKDFPVV